jgi:NAD(P)-dependent dehydrogenase (short-subunit alcohol dehydrogenase family)
MIEMKRLENKVALVTGGNSGIGYATAEALIAQGARVIITGRRKEAVETAAKKIGAIGLTADQSDIKSADELAAEVENLCGKIDILILNAGMALFSPIDQVKEEEYDKIMDTNLKGVFFTLQSFLRILNEGAAVSFVSSYSAYNGSPNAIVYSASKAALNSMTRTTAVELASRKIRVNAVCPGMIETPVFTKLGFPDEIVQRMKESLIPKVPLKRVGSPAEVANLLVFLSSDAASYITGSEYIIDGGLSLNPLS